jgi:aerobic carbon-monoxide dehydrogenase small subunit
MLMDVSVVSVTVNGTLHVAGVQPRTLLVDFLRDELGLTGTKVGCEDSYCGSCVVLVDGTSVKSCSVLAVQSDGSQVTTIEGLDVGRGLHDVQEAFRERHGLQCGFCTAGMVMSVVDLLARNPSPDEEAARQWLEGHLCRCTGYQNVVDAIRYAAELLKSPTHTYPDTPGKLHYQRQVGFLMAKDVDGLVDNQYHEDATLVSHEFQVRGTAAIKQHFREYLRWLTIDEVLSTDHFTETENSVFFEATVRSNFGVKQVFDIWLFEDGKIRYHFTGVK